MTDVTTGSLLADRYRLISRAESDLADIVAWQATDQILDRTVRVAIVSGSRAQAALDEARRAALVADPRIVRVVDAGVAGDERYIVLDDFLGDDLSVLTSARPLAADQARAIIGEAAAALDAAQQRGVYHLALRPQAIRVHEGRVNITGLGFDGVLNPGARGDSPTAARADVVGLLSLLFYVVSGKWPSDNLTELNSSEGALLPERVDLTDGKPPSLADMAPDLPDDLVAIVDRTLTSRSDGPRTAGELVAALGPWGQVTVTPPRMFDSVSPAQKPPTDPSAKTQTAASPMSPNSVAADPPTPVPVPVVRQSVRSTFVSGEKRQVLPGTPPPATPTTEPGRVARRSVLSASSSSNPGNSPQRSTPSVPSVPSAPSTVSPASPAAAPWAPIGPGQSTQSSPSSPLKFDELVSAPREYRRFRFNPTALTLIIAAVAVVLGVPYALNGIAPALTNPFATKTIERPALPGEDPTNVESTPSATEAPVVTPVIESGDQLDPQGDNNEHPEAVHLAYDQDPSTFWFTRTYQSATFQGMGREGIGYAVKLEQAAPVSTVYLSTNNTGGNVEVRATDPNTPAEGKVLASGPMSAEMTLDLSETVEAEHIVLWFTELPQTSNGDNRVELREITLT